MRTLVLAALLALVTGPALADSYLVQSSVALAQAKSAAACVGCDGVQTVYWWPVVGGAAHLGGVVPPAALSAALDIASSGSYGPALLSPVDQALLQAATALTALGWVFP